MSVPVGRVRNLGSEMCMPDRHSEMAMISFEGFGGAEDIAVARRSLKHGGTAILQVLLASSRTLRTLSVGHCRRFEDSGEIEHSN